LFLLSSIANNYNGDLSSARRKAVASAGTTTMIVLSFSLFRADEDDVLY
jgi:hypothetical protein